MKGVLVLALALGGATDAPTVRWLPVSPRATWSSASLPVGFVLANPPSRDVGAAADLEVELALRTWSRPACSGWRGRFDGARTLTGPEDGVNGIFFHDAGWPVELEPGVLAETVLRRDAKGALVGADIHLNSAEFRFSVDGAPGTQDLRSVLVHELGHALGLGHSDDPRATMFVTGSGRRWRSLEPDDIEGVCALYPGSGAPSCDVDPCPSGSTCVAGECQRPKERANVCAPCGPEEPSACEAAGDAARCVVTGAGETSGFVCGRGCRVDGDCGSGFACEATTEAGDRQCISRAGCVLGGHPCTNDDGCVAPARCLGGICKGPRAERDVGAASPASPMPAPAALEAHGSGCAASPGAPGLLGLGLVFLVLRRRLRSTPVSRQP